MQLPEAPKKIYAKANACRPVSIQSGTSRRTIRRHEDSFRRRVRFKAETVFEK